MVSLEKGPLCLPGLVYTVLCPLRLLFSGGGDKQRLIPWFELNVTVPDALAKFLVQMKFPYFSRKGWYFV